jgi:UDP-glucuronate 4-epimerase
MSEASGTTLVTGAAGFIGFHVAQKLLRQGRAVVGFDSVNDYYDPALKEARLELLSKVAEETGTPYAFVRADLADPHAVDACFESTSFARVIHLAAQAGVRYSLDNPRAYVRSNIDGFVNILESCRHARTPHLTYASTSSVYGANTQMPFSEHHATVHPIQFYAATKRANELMAHAYSHLYELPTTGLRFFTVYGPWGRPDMALFKFTQRILAGEPIEVYGYGHHTRDFTYVDDIAEAVIRVSDTIAEPSASWDGQAPDPATSSAPWRLYNIGNNQPVKLLDLIGALEKALGKTAQMEMLPLQPGDVPDTYADVSALEAAIDYRPATSIVEGVQRFVDWYRGYYG